MRATCYLLAVARDLWSRSRVSLVCTIAYFRHDYRVGGCASDTVIYVSAVYFFKSLHLVNCCILTLRFYGPDRILFNN